MRIAKLFLTLFCWGLTTSCMKMSVDLSQVAVPPSPPASSILLKASSGEFVASRNTYTQSNALLYKMSSVSGIPEAKVLRKSNSGNYILYSSVQGQIISEE